MKNYVFIIYMLYGLFKTGLFLIQDPRQNSSFYDLILKDRVSYGSIIGNINDVLINKKLINKTTKILDYKLIYYSPQLIPSSLFSNQKDLSLNQMEPIFSLDPSNGSILIKTPNEPLLEYLCLKKHYCSCISCIFSLNIIYRTQAKINAETIRLFIDDFNEFPPQFVSNSQQFSLKISESSKIGDEFELENSIAYDSDAFYNQINYYLSNKTSGEDRSSLFEVYKLGQNSLKLVLKSHLDYELIQKYELYLIAKDNGQPQLYNYKKLIINILDENDNKPICEKSLFIESVKENLRVKNLIQIKAIDLDLTSELHYELEEEFREYFQIDNFGWLSVIKELDYELNQYYNLKVQVYDIGLKNNYTTFCSVRINIIDQNDNQAKFKLINFHNNTSNKNDNLLQIYENYNNLKLALIKVFDKDTLSDYKFQLESNDNNSESNFKINKVNNREYELVTLEKFDAELLEFYNLNIILHDSDEFKFNSSLKLQVLDLNDNRPEFVKLFYDYKIKENDSNEIITNQNPIEIYDRDITELNSRINFKLICRNNSINISEFIKINYENYNFPKLILIKPFDYEIHGDRINLDLVGYDIDGLNDTSEIILWIENINDNPPLFLNDNTTFKLKENSQIDTFIGQLITEDKDTPKSDLNFKLLNYDNLFKVYKSGVISNRVILDRELQSLYTLKIEVSDQGNLSTIGIFYIEIQDENDNRPIFVYPTEETKHLNLKLESSGFLFDTKAIDYDLDSKLTYSIQDSLNMLIIDSQNGGVWLNSSENKTEIKAILQVCLSVVDSGTPRLETTLNFTLYINYEIYELDPEVQKMIKFKHEDSNLFKLSSGNYKNFFQIVSQSVLLIILITILLFMFLIVCFILIIMLKKVNKKKNSESNFLSQVKDMFRERVFNWSKVSNLTVKDEIITNENLEPISVENFRIIARPNEPLMTNGNSEILNSESLDESNGTNFSGEFTNNLNVYSQEFSNNIKMAVQRFNNSYLTTSNNDSPPSLTSSIKEIKQDDVFNYQSYYKQSLMNNLNGLNQIDNQCNDLMEKFERFYNSSSNDYSIDTKYSQQQK
ncbi:unnamed protein product [Brachionus calyciflorus]|uniref:Cadherin domain-containing protein n=1 Tax=Brachionus calyciflorus TaxID=104777 RepID=A0A813Q476_9BILA|nr:unnamed protein product [Brachionus calyciflorus]